MERKTHTIDVSGEILGRVASRIATLLQGKHKPSYVPHHDKGDFVEIENVEKVKLSGKKMEQKTYFSHSGYLGHEKETSVKKVFEENPGAVLRRAVRNMLPKNKLRKGRMKRLKIK